MTTRMLFIMTIILSSLAIISPESTLEATRHNGILSLKTLRSLCIILRETSSNIRKLNGLGERAIHINENSILTPRIVTESTPVTLSRVLRIILSIKRTSGNPITLVKNLDPKLVMEHRRSPHITTRRAIPALGPSMLAIIPQNTTPNRRNITSNTSSRSRNRHLIRKAVLTKSWTYLSPISI